MDTYEKTQLDRELENVGSWPAEVTDGAWPVKYNRNLARVLVAVPGYGGALVTVRRDSGEFYVAGNTASDYAAEYAIEVLSRYTPEQRIGWAVQHEGR